jgi:hypothetical protein
MSCLWAIEFKSVENEAWGQSSLWNDTYESKEDALSFLNSMPAKYASSSGRYRVVPLDTEIETPSSLVNL